MTSSTFVEIYTRYLQLQIQRHFTYIEQSTKSNNVLGKTHALNFTDSGLGSRKWQDCVPVRYSLPTVPEELLKTIYCKCKTVCDTRRCTCKEHGLECSVAYAECHGSTCYIIRQHYKLEDEEEDADEQSQE